MNNDCLLYVFGFLTAKDLVNCSFVCSWFNKLAKNELLWSRNFKSDFYNVKCTKDFYNNYKMFYILDGFLEKCICKNINHVINRISLNLYSNDLRTLPKEICLLTSLRTLFLDKNDFHTFPQGIYQLFSLEYLNLSANYLQFLPPEIGKLSLLQRLHLNNNNLQTLPKEIGQLSLLKELNLHTII